MSRALLHVLPIIISDMPQYSLGFHPNPDKALVFAGDKFGNLGTFDASQPTPPVQDDDADDEDILDRPPPDITAFHLHTRTISTFLFQPSSPSTLLSASYDSSIRSLDLRESKATQIYAPADEDADEPISGLDVAAAAPHTLYFSTIMGAFGRHDMRAPAGSATSVVQLADKKIGGFSLHPTQPHLMATASLDRTLKVWDLRKMGAKGGALPALLGEHESRLSVSHASWNAVGQVATASYDDTIKIHDFAACGAWRVGHKLGEEAMRPKTVIKHNNQTGRWVTMLVVPILDSL